jgi:integrase
VESDKLRGAYIDTNAGKVSFGECARQWAAVQHHRPMTAELVDRHLSLYILPTLGDRPVGAVRPSEVQALVKQLSDRLAPSSVRVVYARVAAVFAAAVRDRRIASSPCVGITLPKGHKPPVEPLPTEAVHALTQAMPPRYRALVTLAAGTGLRQGECFGLDVGHVDFLRRQIRVEQQLVTVSGKPPYLGPPKTDASIRTVPLPSVVGETLAAHIAANPPGEWGLVFTTVKGAPMHRGGDWAHAWRRAVRTAGLPAGIRFHDLRHYYASLLIHAGESVKVVQARLGHANASETLDTYSHLWPDSEDRTRQAIDSALNAGVPPVCPENEATT